MKKKYMIEVVGNPNLKNPKLSSNIHTGKLIFSENQIEIETSKISKFKLDLKTLTLFSLVLIFIYFRRFLTSVSWGLFIIIGYGIILFVYIIMVIKSMKKKESVIIDLTDIKSFSSYPYSTGVMGKGNKIINIKTGTKSLYVFPYIKGFSTNNKKEVQEILDYIEMKKNNPALVS